MKYTELSSEKLHRDICIPVVKSCEAVSTRDVSLVSSNDFATGDVTCEPITFNHVGHTASEEESGSSEVVDGELKNEVFEEKPIRYYAEEGGKSQVDTKERESKALASTAAHASAGNKDRVHTSGSFLVIDSP